MTLRLLRLIAALSAFLGAAGLWGGGSILEPAASLAADGGARVVVLEATGVVDPVLAGYLADGLARAADDGAAAVVIRLNTPGGALTSTNDIVGSLLEARLPVIVWVSPAGGFAASAGTFITLAANLAYMAPGTSIGAASPISGSGEDIEGTLGDKVKNDAIAKITSIAEARGRNVEWAISTVRDARSSPASEAVELGAVDGIAATLADVLAAADGQVVQVLGTDVTLALADADVETLAMNPLQAFLHILVNPDFAFLLFSVGSLALLYEVMNPNFVTGILGALFLILAFIGLGSLPLNVGGLLLIVLGLILFGLEVTVTSHGLLALGGTVCFVLGASALYSAPGDPTAPIVGVATPVLVVMTVTFASFAGLIAWAAVRSRAMVPTPGLVGSESGIVGADGVVRAPLGPLGSVYAAGEEWSARTADGGDLERGTSIRIVGLDGLTVIVEPAVESASTTTAG